MFKSILVATDFTPGANQAVELALEMAARDQADLVVLHVFEIPSYMYPGVEFAAVDYLGPLQEAAQRQFDQLCASVRGRWPRMQGLFKEGTAWEQILAVIAETHADLVVVGTHGRRGLAHALLGSIAEKVVRLSPVPVMTVRQSVPDSAR